MNDTLTIPRSAKRARRPDLVPAVLVGIGTALLLVLVSLTLRTPEHVSLTVRNPLDWRADVSVRAEGDPAWTHAGAVPRNGELELLRLPDQGDEWVVRFSYAGAQQEVTVSRGELAANGWRIDVPDELGEDLEEAGVAPTTGSTAGRAGDSEPPADSATP